MRFDLSAYRHLSSDQWRVLHAVERGNQQFELVPTERIESFARLRTGGTRKHLRELLKHRLVSHDNHMYDAFRLTSLGLDYLALRALRSRNAVHSIGSHVGTGKEADVLLCCDANGNNLALKLHRLGRTSFKKVARSRDYGGQRLHQTWLHMSKRSAQKEHSFLKALHANAFAVPRPVDCVRHAVVMEYASNYVMLQSLQDATFSESMYRQAMNTLASLAAYGLVHCDASEFNWLAHEETGLLLLIDMPQIVSISHRNAPELLRRDVQNLKAFFARRFRIDVDSVDNVDEPEHVLSQHRQCALQQAETDAKSKDEDDLEAEEEASQSKESDDSRDHHPSESEGSHESFCADEHHESGGVTAVRLDKQLRASGFNASVVEQEDYEELLQDVDGLKINNKGDGSGEHDDDGEDYDEDASDNGKGNDGEDELGDEAESTTTSEKQGFGARSGVAGAASYASKSRMKHAAHACRKVSHSVKAPPKKKKSEKPNDRR